MLSDKEKSMLKSVARPALHPDFGKTNFKLDDLTKSIKLLNPSAFLTNEELKERRFFHKPSINIPFKSFEKDRV